MADKYVQSSPVLQYDDGTLVATERIGPQGQMLTDFVHGEFYEASRIGTLFWAANQAATAVSVAYTINPYTGLCLYNPVGNNRDLILRGASFKASIAIVALTVVGLMGGYVASGAITAHGTPLVFGTAIGCCNLGSNAVCTALVDSSCTMVGPKLMVPMVGTMLAAAGLIDSGTYADFHGGFIIQPGAYVAFHALTAVTGMGCFIWEEVKR
jgi:hypothetical protein